MIAGDQFTNLPDDLLFVFSSRQDGTVLDRSQPTHNPSVLEVRQSICEQAGVSYENVVYQRVIYSDTSTYDVLVEVDDTSTTRHLPDVAADGLFTRQPGVGLFLSVADCIVTVIFDPNKRFLAQLHMGRHSTLTALLTKAVDTFKHYGSDLRDLRVWMAPAVTKNHYRLEYFDHADDAAWHDFVERRDNGYYLDMQGYNQAQLIACGIPAANITISPIDTFENENYFSHFRGDRHGRFAGLAMMR